MILRASLYVYWLYLAMSKRNNVNPNDPDQKFSVLYHPSRTISRIIKYNVLSLLNQ